MSGHRIYADTPQRDARTLLASPASPEVAPRVTTHLPSGGLRAVVTGSDLAVVFGLGVVTGLGVALLVAVTGIAAGVLP